MIYLSTIVLMEENGIKFKLIGDDHASFLDQKTH